MEASDITEGLRRAIETGDALPAIDGFDVTAETGHDDGQFFIRTEVGETFLVVVAKVSE